MNRAAVHRTVVDRRQEDDGPGRRHQEGQRQQDCDAVDRAQARHRTDKKSERAATDNQQQVLRFEYDQESLPE